jgi:hypothetical protein
MHRVFVARLIQRPSVEIKKMAPEDGCSSDMLVVPRRNNRDIAVSLYQLKPICVDESMNQATRPSKTGITGSAKATASDLRTSAETSQKKRVSEHSAADCFRI